MRAPLVVLTMLHTMPRGDQLGPTRPPRFISHTWIRDDSGTEAVLKLKQVKEVVSGLRGGANNWVELALDPQKESVGLVSCKHVVLDPDALPAVIPEVRI